MPYTYNPFTNNLDFFDNNLSSGMTGTLPEGNGGTGETSYLNGQLLIGNTSSGGLDKATLTITPDQGLSASNGAGSITLTLANATVTTKGSAFYNAADFQVNSGNVILQPRTGDVTSLSGNSNMTLATVNSNVGSFGSSTAIANFTVNGKGLITAAGTNVVIAPAGTLTGTSLASGVVSSSLTSVGTLTSLAITGDLTVDTSTFFVDASANRVAIGITTPITRGEFLTTGNGRGDKYLFRGGLATQITAPTGTKAAIVTIMNNENSPGNGPAILAITTLDLDSGGTTGGAMEFLATNATSTQIFADTYVALTDTQIIGSLNWLGDDGTNVRTSAAAIDCLVDGTPSVNKVPGKLRLRTATTGGAITSGIEIDNAQNVSIPNGDVIVTNNVHIGDSTPAGEVDVNLNLYGPNSNINGPHTNYSTVASTHPAAQKLVWNSDNVSDNAGCYFNGSSFISSDAGSNSQIYKFNDELLFRYKSGITIGNVITFNRAVSIDLTNGDVAVETGHLKCESKRAIFQGSTALSGTTDGIEIGHDNTDGIILSFDRAAAAYRNLKYNALSHEMRVSDANALEITSTGIINLDKNSAFFAYNNAVQANVTGDGTIYTVQFNTEIYDVRSEYNNSTFTFTAEESGIYTFGFTIEIEAVNAHRAFVVTLVTSNNSFILVDIDTSSIISENDTGGIGRSIDCEMDAADTVTLTLQITTSTKTADILSSGVSTNFYGSKTN